MGFLLDISLFFFCVISIILGVAEPEDYVIVIGTLLFASIDLVRRLKYQSALRRRIDVLKKSKKETPLQKDE